MRKVLFLLTVLCLLSTVAFAESTTAMNWSDVAATVEEAGWGGGFVELDGLGLMMYVPETLQYQEMEGFFATFVSTDGEAGVFIMVDTTDATTIEELGEIMTAGGAQDLGLATINELPCIGFSIDDYGYVEFLTENGYTITFGFTPMSDEGFAAVAGIIMASIQAV